MGNSNKSEADVDIYNHPRLGSIKRIQQQASSQCIGMDLVLENQKIYDDWVKQLRLIRREEGIDQIIFLPLEHSFKQTAYCGTGGIVSLRFEDYFYSLLPEIANRREIKRPFNQQELLYLFYNLVKAAALLQAGGRSIGDVKPENILVNQDGYVKIVAHVSWPGIPFKLARGWEKGGQRLLLAPEQCEERQRKRQLTLFTTQDPISEAFSIAVTVLEAGSLRDCVEIYGEGYQYRFNDLKVREYLDIFEARYSRSVTELLCQMLSLNPQKRLGASLAYQLLKPYDYQILNLEQIAIDLAKCYLPRIEREEKVSIRKMGDSMLGESHTYPVKQVGLKNSHPKQSNLHPVVSPYQSSIHFLRENQSQRLAQNQLNSSAYQPSFQPSHQLVNQFTNFNRVGAPLQSNFTQALGSSLPLKLSGQYQSSEPQYLMQHSAITTLGPNQIEKGFGRFN